jgi:2,3-bisphosphoglycerate-dependent phosphoglycerate mutase
MLAILINLREMKRALLVLTVISALSIFSYAQDKTIVLVRHAEKDSAAATMNGDDPLSEAGRERSARLLKIVKKYRPHEIFATAYRRTQQTVEPIAAYRKKQVQTYDPSKQADLVSQIMASKTEHYLIAGHSNTIPALANLLAKKEIFKQVPDTEYGVIWVVKIRNGVLKRVEVYSY